MQALLQQHWEQSITLLSHSVFEKHVKALMVFLASFSLLGGGFALMTLGLFCAYLRISATDISVVTYTIGLQGNQLWVNHAEANSALSVKNISVSPYSLRLQLQSTTQKSTMTIWRWQVSDRQWRNLCALLHAHQ